MQMKGLENVNIIVTSTNRIKVGGIDHCKRPFCNLDEVNHELESRYVENPTRRF